MGDMCNGPGWLYGIFGILFLITGYFLWSGIWTLEQGVGALIVLFGLIHLGHCCAPQPTTTRRRRRR